MKLWLIAALLLGGAWLPMLAQDAGPKPEELTMTLAWVADAGEPKQHVFVINGVVAYKTVDGLKRHLQGVPKGTRLTWAPGCGRIGGEPLLASQEELQKFREFCESHGITFVLVPSG